jgi:sugar lactone lactonase YvrE
MQKLKLLALLLLMATLVVACNDTTTTTTTPTAVASVAATTAAAASSGSPVSANNLVKAIAAITQAGDFNTPLDSTPDTDGTNVYFIASNSKGAGVFKVASAGGTANEVVVGAPFVAPHAIAISPDGQQIFVADTKAGNGGQIFVLPITGGTPTVLNGSSGTAPQNLTVVNQAGQAQVYFTGKEASSGGQPAVFKLPTAGASAATVLAKGTPLVEPDGVAVTKSGSIYVADRSAAGNGSGQVFKVADQQVTTIVTKVNTGNPAGIALTQDDSTLLVSALQDDNPNDQVLVVNLANLKTSSVTNVVGQNQSAGGVHAIPTGKQNLFAWAGKTRGGVGTVYKIELN